MTPRGRRGAPPGPAPEADRVAAKRTAFFAAAEPLFDRYGYPKTTVGEICRAAGASKRTFYEVFDDKADLALQWMLHVSAAIVTRFEATVAPGMGAAAKLDRFLDEYARLARDHGVFGQMMKDPDLLRAFGRHTEDPGFLLLMGVLRDILAEGIESGEFRPLDADRVTWIVFSLLDTMFFLVPATGALEGPLADEGLARELRAFITHALLPPRKGGAA